MMEYEISDHAKEAMEDDKINEEEVKQCLEHGGLQIKEIVHGETRYGKQLELKDKKLMVIYTIRGEIYRVITAYTIQRKQTWQAKN